MNSLSRWLSAAGLLYNLHIGHISLNTMAFEVLYYGCHKFKTIVIIQLIVYTADGCTGLLISYSSATTICWNRLLKEPWKLTNSYTHIKRQREVSIEAYQQHKYAGDEVVYGGGALTVEQPRRPRHEDHHGAAYVVPQHHRARVLGR